MLRQETITKLVVALRAWQPGWSVGAACVYMREDYYKNSVAFNGGPQRNAFVMLIRNGDELSGMMSRERVVDALALYSSLVMLAPAH